MSLVLFARVVIGLIFSAMLGWVVIDRQHNEAGEDWIGRASEVQRYLPYVSGGLLPLFLELHRQKPIGRLFKKSKKTLAAR